MSPARVLVMAKAPVPGLAKTRLGHDIGMEQAADLAAAALLDTLAACRDGFAGRYLALTGDLTQAARSDEVVEALTGWTVFEQVGATFADRLAHAHRSVADHGAGPVVQLGMDTPQLTPELLRSVTDGLASGAEVVLGPAEDGGWWVLGLADGHQATALVGVPMSDPETFTRTREAFAARGLEIARVATLRDVDTAADATAVARQAPATLFAGSWRTAATRFEVAR